MKKTNETDSLDELIIATEQQRARDLVLLKEGLHEAYDNIKPVNFIKKVFNDIAASPDLKANAVSNTIAIGAGFLYKKLVSGNTPSPFRKLVGTVAGFIVTNLVSKHSGDIVTVGNHLLKRFANNLTAKKEKDIEPSTPQNDNTV